MKTGILGGTFDPIHNGHIQLALETRKALGLDNVLLIPAGQPLLKPERKITPAEHRLTMLQLAVKGIPELAISKLELEREGPSYTVNTLEELRKNTGAHDELYFILGWDNLEKLMYWKEPEKILTLCIIVAVPRPGYQKPSMDIMEKALPGITEKTVMLDRPHINISASKIRKMAAEERNIDDMVPAAVAEYIAEKKLYAGEPEEDLK